MLKESDNVREKILQLIGAEYESDAAFERKMGLSDKTVNNWRRGLSSSYMKMLPELSEVLSVNVTELLDIPLSADKSDLSSEEAHLLNLYRKSRTMSPKLREALRETLESVINLYIKTSSEEKAKGRRRSLSDTAKKK